MCFCYIKTSETRAVLSRSFAQTKKKKKKKKKTTFFFVRRERERRLNAQEKRESVLKVARSKVEEEEENARGKFAPLRARVVLSPIKSRGTRVSSLPLKKKKKKNFFTR